MPTERDLRTVEAAIQDPQAGEPYIKSDGKETRLLEGAEIYGDVGTAEHYGYVARGYGNSSDDNSF